MSSSLTPRKLRAIKLAKDRIISYTIENKIEQSIVMDFVPFRPEWAEYLIPMCKLEW